MSYTYNAVSFLAFKTNTVFSGKQMRIGRALGAGCMVIGMACAGGGAYGQQPASIYATIAYGRPNGLPAFAERVPEDQIWQPVAYVCSLSGQLPSSIAPSRGDCITATSKPEAHRPKEKVRPEPPSNPSELR
jgi:hypothetical protein